MLGSSSLWTTFKNELIHSSKAFNAFKVFMKSRILAYFLGPAAPMGACAHVGSLWLTVS